MQFETTFVIAPDHPAFAGHFPGTPIVPGVVLLDAVIHALRPTGRFAASGDGADTAPLYPLCQISAAKFLSPVGPGETLTLLLTPGASGSTRFDVSSGQRKVATGTLVLPPPAP